MRNIFIFLSVICLLSCSKENEPNYVVSGVYSAEDFLDVRNQKLYKCIEIGDQIWMAENLAYRLEGVDNNLDCRTWEEAIYSMSIDSVQVSDDILYPALMEALDNGELANPMTTWYMNFWDVFGMMYDPRGYTVEGLMEELITGWGVITDEMEIEALWEDVYTIKRQYAGEVIAESLENNFQEAEKTNGGYASTYGLLYSLEGAKKAVPVDGGWRLPTDDDWKKLEQYLGMSVEDANLENAWRGDVQGEMLKEGEHGIGFNALYGGGKLYVPTYSKNTDNDTYTKCGQNAYFWTSEEFVADSAALGIIRSVAVFSEQILRTTTRIVNEDNYPVLYSVRLVRDKK